MGDYPMLRHGMDEARPGGRARELMREHPGYIERVLDEVPGRGPLTVAGPENPGQRAGPW